MNIQSTANGMPTSRPHSPKSAMPAPAGLGRWLAVLPAAFGGSWFAVVMVGQLLTLIVGDPGSLPIIGRILAVGVGGLACGSVGVALGVAVAPAAKRGAALSLGVLYALCCGYWIFPVLQQEEYMSAYFGVVTALSALLTTSAIRDALRDASRPPASQMPRDQPVPIGAELYPAQLVGVNGVQHGMDVDGDS